MKFILQIFTTFVFAFAFQYFLPWWTAAIACIMMGYYFKNGAFKSFCAGFLAIGLLWFAMALYIDVTSQSILTEKVNQILPAPALALTSLIGALVGGFSAMSGALLRKGKKRENIYHF